MENSGFLSSCKSGFGPLLEFQGGTRELPLEVQQGSQSSSVVAAGNSELLRVAVHDSVPLEPWRGIQGNTRVGGYPGFLSTCGGGSSRVVLG